MRKIWAIMAVLLVLVSCRKEVQEFKSGSETGAVNFVAYSATQVTRGVSVGQSDVLGADGSGIGVFAFLQNAVSGNKVDFNSQRFPVPDFMYNQRVSEDGGVWSYKPLKYWPNEAGDQVSFFAYAPYDNTVKWEDLGFSTDASSSYLQCSLELPSSKGMMKDILWADPQINQSNKLADGSNNLNKIISFNFRHLLSKILLEVGVDNSKTLESNAEPWDDANTDITIDKIVFSSLADHYNFRQTNGSSPIITWTASGSRDVVLQGDDMRNTEINEALWGTDWWDTVADPKYYKDVLSKERGLDGTDTTAALFFAPQVFEKGVQTISITYTVNTVDPLDARNNFKKTITITKDLSDVFPKISGTEDSGTETGKAYLLKILIGMNSVRVSGDGVDWDSEESGQADVPANFKPVIFTAKIASMATKTIISTGGVDAGKSNWVTGDSITVKSYLDGVSRQAVYTTNEIDGEGTATFKYATGEKLHRGAGVTYSATYGSSPSLAQNHSGNYLSDNEANGIYMVSGNPQADTVLTFTAAASLMRISVSAESSDTCKVLSKIEVALQPEVGEKQIYTLDCGNVDISTAKTFYVSLPAGNCMGVVCHNRAGYVWQKAFYTSSVVESNTIHSLDLGEINFNLLPGKFTVGDGRQVRFTKGNLYWDGSSYHFLSTQYELPGSSYSSSHVTNLYWATTAEAAHTKRNEETGRSSTDRLFCDGADAAHRITVDGVPELFVLSKAEWDWIYSTHTFRYGCSNIVVPTASRVEWCYCCLLAPDGYDSVSYPLNDSYNSSEWSYAQARGLVYLQLSGYRCDNSAKNYGQYIVSDMSGYWTSTTYDDSDVYANRMSYSSGTRGSVERTIAFAYRLVSLCP